MKKIAFLILLIGFSTYVKSQQPPIMVEVVNPKKFNIIVDTNTTTAYTSVLETDSFYISATSGNFNGATDYYQSIILKAVNKNYGYCLKKNLFVKSSIFGIGYPISLIRLDSSNMFMLITVSSTFAEDTTSLHIIYCRIKEATSMFMGFIDTLWSKTICFNNLLFGSAIKSDSNFVIGVGKNDTLPYLFKLNKSNGNIVYDTLYSILSGYHSYFTNIIKTNDNGYLSLGSTALIGDGIHYNPGYALSVKLNKDFQVEWITKFRPSGAPYSEDFTAYDAVQLADSGYLVAGRLSRPGIYRLDKNGNVKWWRRYPYNGDNSHYGHEFDNVHKINDNKYILVGAADSIGYETAFTYMLCIDSMGTEIWHRKLYGLREKSFFNENSYSVQTMDGGFLIGGYINEMGCIMFPKGDFKSYFIKTDSLGCDDCGSCDTTVHLSAFFKVNSSDDIYKPGTPIMGGYNAGDTLCKDERIVVKFKIAGGEDDKNYFVNIYKIGEQEINSYEDCPSQQGLEKIATIYNVKNGVINTYLTEPLKDTLEGLFLFGYYNNNYYDSYEIGANTIDSTFGSFFGLRQFFKVDTTCIIGVQEVALESNMLKLYPNPATEFITIESERLMNGGIYIINTLGLVVTEEEIMQENEKTIDIRTLPAGLYLLKYKEQMLRFSVIK